LPNHPDDALAGGPINQSGDTIEVVLIQPADNPSVIMIRWPDAPPSPHPPATSAASLALLVDLARRADTRIIP
jgi:hypothetical protein